MNISKRSLTLILLVINSFFLVGQEKNDKLLTIDRIYNSSEFRQEYQSPIQWIENGEAYVIIEKSATNNIANELIKYTTATQKREVLIASEALQINGKPITIESFSLSLDHSKILIFTNSSRVWRLNTKGDYWLYDIASKKIRQIGQQLIPSSLQFAKLSSDNSFVIYVYQFNLYKENLATNEVTQLTFNDGKNVINGTFDWAYEEEFGKRDGFMLNEKSDKIAFWQQDVSTTGTFYMINNTDSIYSKPIPIQYPKVGEDPSSTKVGIVDLATNKTTWIPVEGDAIQNYIPGMQWVTNDLLLIQQLNRKQNELTVWSYRPSSNEIKKIYTEKEPTWVDLDYPDISRNGDSENNLILVDNNESFLRLTENGTWRNVIKVTIKTGTIKKITPFNFDVAIVLGTSKDQLYFIASPKTSTQRYLYATDLQGRGKYKRITPEVFSGINTYNLSPNVKYAFHSNQSTAKSKTTDLINLPNHKVLKNIIENKNFKEALSKLSLPEIKFLQLKTENGIEIDARVVYPINFDASKKYPVLFHVYGEPWGSVANDTQIGLWNIMMAQKGFIIVDMDNRGTPCLKGSQWRKSIYKRVGVINASDQAEAAKELLKLSYADTKRVGVWGWSGGGSMTLNLLFKYPEIYKTGVAVAAVANQLTYDNIYQERYMGLPQENKQEFIDGSPITYAKNLKGNLLYIHGTGDDNVHYQNAEMLINELIKQNKQFQVFPYPNRSHGIYEEQNTSRHLYTMITNYFMDNLMNLK
ncbi:MAG: prolyl oligopeptidase family serine peptidase [Flavobacterium sp.]|nr:prolyl oligopeptidase family serine peptidase [Flavobacterium sp.]